MLISGRIALALIVAVTLLAFYGLIGFASEGPDWGLLNDSYFQQILWFSIKQAALSALLSLLLAWPLARALYYLPDVKGRPLFLSLCILCFVMPTLVLITGLVSLLGRNGLISPLLGEDWNLYGLNGILLAHIYLNMPFAVRGLLQQLNNIPDTSWKLAAQLKLSPLQRLITVEWPAIRSSVLMLGGFIFVLCFNSFAVVLALGGGPKATTLEVAIYQALKYDFNIPEALTLAWTQLLIAGGLFLMLTMKGSVGWLSADTASQQWTPRPRPISQNIYRLIYLLGWCLLLLPIVALFTGIDPDALQRFDLNQLIQPTLTSLVLALAAALLAISLSYLILQPLRRAIISGQYKRQILLEWLATHTLVAPAMVLSVGLYIFLLPRINPEQWGMIVVVLLNCVTLVPFALQQLKPRLIQFDQQYFQLCQSLKLTPAARLRIEWPFIRPVLLSSLALVLVLAIGDLAIFSIFGNQQWTTLPWLIYGYAGSYRISEAALASLVLLAICGVILWLFERYRTHANH